MANLINDVKSLFICSITGQPLNQAVTIVPCGCRVDKEMIEKITSFQEQLLILPREKNAPCPNCKLKMHCMFLDKPIQDIANRFFQKTAEVIASEKLKKRSVSRKSFSFKRDSIDSKGKLFEFSHLLDEADSALQSFKLYQYNDGSFSLNLQFKVDERLKNDFERIGIIGIDFSKEEYNTQNIEEIRSLFYLFSEQCSFPDVGKEAVNQVLTKN